jgi:putative ABC transport system permease protein
MKWFDSARARLRLLLARRAAESRMNDEFRFHIEMEADQLMRAKGLAPDEARRQALAAFGGVEKHKEALRDGRGLTWLGSMSLDVKLGGRMLLKYPGLTVAGGLALAIAIGIGTGWYDLSGKFLSPTIPLPEGDRLVSIETQNTLTNESEQRVVRDFLEWRREMRTIEGLGAYRTDTRNLVAGNAAPEPIRMAELTAAAFGTARVPPLLGRGLLDSDEMPGAPGVIVLGYDLWQRTFGGRQDVVGSVVKLGNTPATVIGVMPKGFAYPVNHTAWTPLLLRASYGALEGDAIGVIGRLAPGVTQEQADAELRVLGERAAAALPATHQHLKPRVMRLGEASDGMDSAAFAMRNLPVLLVLIIACVSVGTLVYARTAIREGEIAVRTALGASRARIIGQLFVEALVLASVAAAVGLIGADLAVTWAVENFNQASGGVPFWITPGLKLSTILYAGGLAVVSAVMLSVLPALKATRAGLQSHLANRGAGGATLRFGHVWTGAMIVQVTLTAIGIPVALETASEARRNANIRAAFPSREYLAARIDVDRTFDDETTPAFEARRARTFAELQRRIAQEPGVVAVTFADRSPGSGSSTRRGQVESSAAAAPAYADRFSTSAVGPGFFEAFDRPIVAGRAFHEGDRSPSARTVIVNEAFVREFSRNAGRGSPIGARLRYSASSSRFDASAAEPWFEIVGVVRDFGLDPDDLGNERPFVFHAASADTVSPLVMSVRMRGNPATLAARLPVMAGDINASLLVHESRSMEDWIGGRDGGLDGMVAAQAAVNALALFLSAMSIFSLVSVSVSRRRREIGVRAALGAKRHHLLAGIMSRAIVLVGSGITAGGVLLLLFVAQNWSTEDVALYARYLAVTSAIMLAACLLACTGPAGRALRINPSDALKEA